MKPDYKKHKNKLNSLNDLIKRNEKEKVIY
jgi:hypothetical protein